MVQSTHFTPHKVKVKIRTLYSKVFFFNTGTVRCVYFPLKSLRANWGNYCVKQLFWSRCRKNHNNAVECTNSCRCGMERRQKENGMQIFWFMFCFAGYQIVFCIISIFRPWQSVKGFSLVVYVYLNSSWETNFATECRIIPLQPGCGVTQWSRFHRNLIPPS